MKNFSISFQIKKELDEFYKKTVKLASLTMQDSDSLRYLNRQSAGYFFNQAQTISIIDLYYNSKFVNGPKDQLGQRKIFMNVGKFRTEVAAKQIDLDTKDGKFIPDEYANPWIGQMMQKEFKEWARDSKFGEFLNQCVDNFPKYGTVVAKKCGENEVEFVPLQTLRCEQTADSLEEASYVIEEHQKMKRWEIDEMKDWDMGDLQVDYDTEIDVYERYGYVPLDWLKQKNKRPITVGDDAKYVDAMVICTFDKNAKNIKNTEHIFFAEQIDERPYREAHWNKQQGRWLGLGVMEDLIENQEAKNIIVNLLRRSLHWSSRRLFQGANEQSAAKNLVKDVTDGEIVEVGPQGEIKQIDLTNKATGEFQQFLNEFENNSNQKSFTYEVATGESMSAGTPFRLGVILSQAVNSFFALKREKLALFLENMINDFQVPQFLKDIGNKDKVLAYYNDEPGYEILKEAAMDYVKSEAVRMSLLSGNEVDATTLTQAITPFDAIKTLFFKREKGFYENAKHKFQFIMSDESVDVGAKVQSLTTVLQILIQKGDPRADKVLDRIMALEGENMAVFGTAQAPSQMINQPQGNPMAQATPQLNVQPATAPAGGGG